MPVGVFNIIKAQEEAEAERDEEEAAESEQEPEEEEVLPENPHCCSSFVEKSWFQAVSALVIIVNVITSILELDKPEFKNIFFVPDQAMLGFYVVELCVRAHYFGFLFLFGPCKLVCWNLLDIIVVVAGVLDQWLMPVLPFGESRSVSKVLQLLRLLRLLRVFKIIRVFLDIDLSWTEAPTFQSFIGIVILVNSLLMGMEIDIPWMGWFWIEQVLLCIYVFELGVRLKNFGIWFFSCENSDIVWNVLDFIIVASSVLDSWITPLCGIIMKSLSGAEAASSKKQHGMSLGKVMMLMRMLRLMRILRLAKLVKSVRPLYILVTGVMAALQGVAWVLVLTIVTLYAMGILATSLIGRKMLFTPGAEVPEEIVKPFNSVPNSMFTLFRVMSGAASDAEGMAIDHLMASVPSIKLGFVFFMVTSSWTLLSILTAVVSENMISTTSQQEEEHKLANAEEVRIEHVQQLKELFDTIDVTRNGVVEEEEIEAFLSDKTNAMLTARMCRVPVRDVREVFGFLADDGAKVNLEKFVGHLVDLSSVVTEKSVFKIESRLMNLSRHQSEAFERLQETLTSLQEKSKISAMPNPDKAAEACSREMQKNVETVCKSQLQEVERLMQGFAERTEACLSEVQKKNQGILESVTTALEQAIPKFGVDKFSENLELQLRRMQHDLLRNLRDSESGLTGRPVISQGSSAPPEAVVRESKEQPGGFNDNQTGVQMELSAVQIEALLVATEESIHALEQKTDMFRKDSGPPKKMSKALEQGISALAVDKSSETLESELRMVRHELLLHLGRQSPDSSKVRERPEGVDRAPSFQMEMVAAQIEPQLLATEESAHALQQRAEVMRRKLQGLLEKAVVHRRSALAVDKFSQTLESELRKMLQESLSSLTGQDPEVSKVRDEDQERTGPVAIDATSIETGSPMTAVFSNVEGNSGSYPCTPMEA